MILDKKGRVSWSKRADDDLSSGIRWGLWTGKRDGIPEGNLSFTANDPPMALDDVGLVIRESGVNDSGPRAEPGHNWSKVNQAAAVERVREIQAEFEGNTQNGAPLFGYDPVTVSVGPDEIDVETSDLRFGDDITGQDFGRVVAIRRENDLCVVTMNRDGKINTAREEEDQMWMVLPVIPPSGTREQLPTALSYAAIAPLPYDPLTVSVVDKSRTVDSKDLRLGDDVCGATFGRVIGVEDGAIVLSRDGSRTRSIRAEGQGWAVQVIDRPDRDTLPTALELGTAPLIPR